ncbi:hypothetical protein ACU4GD_39630 [Cupriavidus basilensis]
MGNLVAPTQGYRRACRTFYGGTGAPPAAWGAIDHQCATRMPLLGRQRALLGRRGGKLLALSRRRWARIARFKRGNDFAVSFVTPATCSTVSR